ncbi:MAG: homing endonuclease [Podoviridae sp. ctviO18]|nr:MAG: homing endonuclease [Podoviridae sp. ctviO18]
MNTKLTKGAKFGRLTAVEFSHKNKTNVYWLFRCICGKEKIIFIGNVQTKKTESCGCLHKEITSVRSTTHGKSAHALYWIFSSINARCNNKNSKSYKDYGGRGIKVLWKSFEEFYKDMSVSYQRHLKKYGRRNTSIDRIDNNGHYSKQNCRWATHQEQCLNHRGNRLVTYKGITKPLILFAREFGLDYRMLHLRLKRGWSIEETLTTPARVWPK